MNAHSVKISQSTVETLFCQSKDLLKNSALIKSKSKAANSLKSEILLASEIIMNFASGEICLENAISEHLEKINDAVSQIKTKQDEMALNMIAKASHTISDTISKVICDATKETIEEDTSDKQIAETKPAGQDDKKRNRNSEAHAMVKEIISKDPKLAEKLAYREILKYAMFEAFNDTPEAFSRNSKKYPGEKYAPLRDMHLKVLYFQKKDPSSSTAENLHAALKLMLSV